MTANSETSVFSSYKDAALHVSRAVLHDEQKRNFVKCGNLACQRDSFQTNLDTGSLLNYAVFEEKAAASKKKKKNAKKEGTNNNSIYDRTMYVLTMSDSIFFPEGGGQPADRGTVTIGRDSLKLHVSDAQNVNSVCVLTCQAPKERPQETIIEALSSSIGGIVKQEIDWDRRFDLMTQHSGQHLVSAVALNEFQLLTHSFSLGQKSLTSYIDFTIDANMDIEEHYANMRTVEGICNQRIRENLSMTPTWLDPEDPEFKTKVRSRLLPEGLTGKIRLVEIDGGQVDCNTCCGTHVQTLGSLQMLKFFKMERVKSTTMRVHFAAAKRLLQIMETSFNRQSRFTSMLSCSEDEHVARLTQILDDKKTKEREIKALQEELCACRAREIAEECARNDNVAVLNLGGSADMNFMNWLSTAVIEKIGGRSDGILLLFVAASEDTDEGPFLLSGDVELVDKVGKRTAEILGGRGGGKNGRFQGKGSKVRSALPDVKELLLDAKAG